MAGLLKATLALHHRTLPPQPSVEEENPRLSLAAQGGDGGPFFLPRRPMAWEADGEPRRAAVSSFGFGGTNAHLVLEEAPARARSARRSGRAVLRAVPDVVAGRRAAAGHALAAEKPRAFLFQLSGTRPAMAARSARELDAALPTLEREGTALADLALTLSQRQHGDARLAVVASSFAQLGERLRAAAGALAARDRERPAAGEYAPPPLAAPEQLVPGVAFAQGPFEADARRLALLFPGQGAQRVGLLREAYEGIPSFRARLDQLDDALGAELHARLGGTLRSFLYPELPLQDGAPEPAALAAAEARLTATQICQPAMAAVGLALYELLAQMGVTASAVLGHSLGEFAASAAAGILSPEDCVRLVAQRGLAMVELPLDDQGAMLSAATDRGIVAEVLEGLPEQHREGSAQPVVAANLNHPRQTVLSGSTPGIALARKALEERSIQVTPLEVSHAFHSPLMAGVARAMQELVSALPLQAPALPVVSGITGGLYPHDAARIREIWVRHATAPVDFVSALQTSAAPPPAGAGARVFLTVGAGNALGAFVKGALPERDRLAEIALASREEDGLAQLALALGMLWAAGAPLSLAPIFEGTGAGPCLAPPSPVETQPYWGLEAAGSAASPVRVYTSPQPAALAARGSELDPGAEPDRSNEMDPLVALFREQIALLQTHAKVLQQQAEALSARGTPLPAELAASLGALPSAGTALPFAQAGATRPAAAPASGSGVGLGAGAVPRTARANAAPAPAPASSPVSARSAGVAAVGPALSAAQGSEADAALRADVTHQLVGFVSRISAFPVEAVKTSQTLAGDLGFDSLMTVELDGDIQKAFPAAGGIPRTLLGAQTKVQDLIDHVVRALAAPGLSPAPATNRSSLEAALHAFADAGPELRLFAPRAVPLPVPAAAGETTLPRALVVTRDSLGIADAVAARLAGLGHAVALIDLGEERALVQVAPRLFSGGVDGADLDLAPFFAHAAQAVGMKVGGVLHLAPISAEGTLDGFAAQPLPEALAPLLWAHRLARGQAQGGDAISGGLFVVATRQDGRLGLAAAHDAPGLAVASALGGYAKALARERADERVQRIDLDPALGAEQAADALLAELRSGNAAPEVGLGAAGRFEVELQPAEAGKPLALSANDVVLVSGGARGVGLKLAEALAQSGGAVIVAGRSAAGAQSEAALSALRKRGARAAAYLKWDVASPAPAALAELRAQLGPITALVHAAGVSEDGPSAAKDEASFLRVVSPKLSGLAQLLAATAQDPLRLAVLVSSWAGRFGNAGQVDYSAANAALSAAARVLPALRPGLHAVALDFPPWHGTAMVARIPQLAKAALLERGVPFIDDAAGAAALRAALESGAGGELLLAPERPARQLVHRAQATVLRAEHVYLEDHQLAGTPVLPLASALDLAAGAAAAAVPGPRALQLRDFKLLQPVRIAEGALLTLSVQGEARPQAELRVALSQSPVGSSRPFARAPAYVGFATVGVDAAPALASALPAAPPPEGAQPQLPLSLPDFYAGATFHGPAMQGIVSIESVSASGIVGWVRTSRPSDFIKNGPPAQWTVDPLAIDGAFQLAGYWAWTQLARAGFPVGIEEYVQLEPLVDGPLRASLTLEQSNGDLVRGTIVLQAQDGRVLAIARGVEGEFKHRDPRFLGVRGPAGARARAGAVAAAASAAANATGSGNAGATASGIEASTAGGPHRSSATSESQPAPVNGAAAGADPAASVDEASYRINLFPEVEELEQRLGLAAAFGLKNPYFNVHERVTNDTSVIGGRTMINWSSYNYLGLSGDPNVNRAAQEAVERYGTSVSASRVASGEKPLHRELEQELAQFLGTEDSIVMVSGHGVFVTTIGHLMGPNDLILHDSLAHDCILGGSKLSGAKRRPFPHNDFEALERQLAQLRPHFRRVLIAVEGVYSMDGDIAPLPEFIRLKKKYKCLLLVDEAHSIGVLGERGRGAGEHFDVDRADVDLWMGTLSKSLASCGGYVGGSKTLVQYLKYTAPGFIYSVGITPANAGAALEALGQVQQHPEKVRRLHERARLFLKLSRARGIDTGTAGGSAVVPAILGNSLHSLQVSEALRLRGINVQPILYPAVEETAARLRFFITATHTEQQIRETVEVLAEEIARVRAEGGEAQTGSI